MNLKKILDSKRIKDSEDIATAIVKDGYDSLIAQISDKKVIPQEVNVGGHTFKADFRGKNTEDVYMYIDGKLFCYISDLNSILSGNFLRIYQYLDKWVAQYNEGLHGRNNPKTKPGEFPLIEAGVVDYVELYAGPGKAFRKVFSDKLEDGEDFTTDKNKAKFLVYETDTVSRQYLDEFDTYNKCINYVLSRIKESIKELKDDDGEVFEDSIYLLKYDLEGNKQKIADPIKYLRSLAKQ